MNSLIWLALVSFALSLILTPIMRDVFRSYGVVDEPDQGRKIHKYPIPRVGGIAVAISYAASFFIVHFKAGILDEHLVLVWKVSARGLHHFRGRRDRRDLWGLRPWQKLAGQLIAAGIACWSGVLALDVVGLHGRAWWTIPVTILWLLACSNAFNRVDGMDGLAAGVGMFATVPMFVAALMEKNMALAMATLPLAGCLLGFLCYNFNPATIFLGDSGSLLIGFLLGCYGIIWTQKSATLLGMTAPLMALSLPLLDVGLAITRRLLRKQPIFSADRGHIHHRLLDRGMSPKKAVVILYGICSVVAVLSLFESVFHNNAVSSVIVLLFCAVAWVGIQYLGYAEFSLAGKMIFGGGFQRNVKAELDLSAMQKIIAGARTAADCARVVEQTCGQFGLIPTHMRIAGEDFTGSPEPASAPWEARVTLADGDWIDFVRLPDSGNGAALFLDALSSSLRARVPSLAKARPHVTTVAR